MDLQEGGVIELEGTTLVVEPDKNRIHGAIWNNGAMIEVFFYDKPLEGRDPSDSMKIRITDCNGKINSWHLNVEDALEIIEGLSKAMKKSLEADVPYNAKG